MNCFKFMFVCVACWILLAGCKGTGILLMPSKDDPVNSKVQCSSEFFKRLLDRLIRKVQS